MELSKDGRRRAKSVDVKNFTLSCVMVVQLDSPPYQDHCILKLYD